VPDKSETAGEARGAAQSEKEGEVRGGTRGQGRGQAASKAQGKEQPRRRQARGERRITQLLEAAATVFCSTGYTAASTNAIARTAGVSPGTLYQFFPNKEAIAIELSDRLLHEMRETYSEALAPVTPGTPVEEAVAAAVERFTDFNCRHPVFFALMHGPDVPGRMAEEHDALHATMLVRIEELLSSLLPPAAPAEVVTRTARMVLGMYKAGLELILAHEGAEQEAYVQELKHALVRYLEPVADPGRRSPAS
jgi:AcrR family transcriptional regulator